MSSPNPHPPPPPDRQAAWIERRKGLLAHLDAFRKHLEHGRSLPTQPGDPVPRWDLHEERLNELARRLSISSAEDFPELQELYQDMMLDFQVDQAAMVGVINERMVRTVDMIERKFEERKFEMGSEDRDGLEDLLQPYKDEFREKMLGELPIETRRKLEEGE